MSMVLPPDDWVAVTVPPVVAHPYNVMVLVVCDGDVCRHGRVFLLVRAVVVEPMLALSVVTRIVYVFDESRFDAITVKSSLNPTFSMSSSPENAIDGLIFTVTVWVASSMVLPPDSRVAVTVPRWWRTHTA